jgi:hypothetical protein
VCRSLACCRSDEETSPRPIAVRVDARLEDNFVAAGIDLIEEIGARELRNAVFEVNKIGIWVAWIERLEAADVSHGVAVNRAIAVHDVNFLSEREFGEIRARQIIVCE